MVFVNHPKLWTVEIMSHFLNHVSRHRNSRLSAKFPKIQFINYDSPKIPILPSKSPETPFSTSDSPKNLFEDSSAKIRTGWKFCNIENSENFWVTFWFNKFRKNVKCHKNALRLYKISHIFCHIFCYIFCHFNCIFFDKRTRLRFFGFVFGDLTASLWVATPPAVTPPIATSSFFFFVLPKIFFMDLEMPIFYSLD